VTWNAQVPIATFDDTAFAIGNSLGVRYVEILQAGRYWVGFHVTMTRSPGGSAPSYESYALVDLLGNDNYTLVQRTTGSGHLASTGRPETRSVWENTFFPAGARIAGASLRTAGSGTAVLNSTGTVLTVGRSS
jgi:hypothetical protein